MFCVCVAELDLVFDAVADMTSDGVLESKIMLEPTLDEVGATVPVVKVLVSVTEEEELSVWVEVVDSDWAVVVVFDGVGVTVTLDVAFEEAAVVAVGVALEDGLLE